MNWFLLAVIAVFAGFLLLGWCKGFLYMVFRLFSWFLVLLIAGWMTPHVSQWVGEHTSLAASVKDYSSAYIQQLVESGDDVLGLEFMGISLPDYGQLQSAMGEEVQEWLAVNVYEPFSEKIANWILYGTTFLVLLIALSILIFIIGKMIESVNDIPVLGTANRLLGMLAGAMFALFFIWVVMAIIAVCGAFGGASALLAGINASPVLQWLYQNNLILECLLWYW